jgi:glycosyltransferase involved in cell wall biosynthesis
MRISIAMATYNGALYIQEQLESIANQLHLPDEIVICDDGSTDETISIINEFSLKVSFSIILIKNSVNLGYIRNFEKAISLCTGDLIFLSDQDDIWFPFKTRNVIDEFLKRKKILLLVHDGKLVDEQLNWFGVTKLGQVRSGFKDEARLVTGALSVLHKDLIKYILPIPPEVAALNDVGHDGWIHLVAKFIGVRTVFEKQLQFIRRHSSNTSEWIASSIREINTLSVLKENLQTTAAASYCDRMKINLALQSRIIAIHRINDDFLCDSIITDSLDHLASENLAISMRNCLLNSSFFIRKLIAIKMLFTGKYKYFNGGMSFIRDIIR